MNSGSDPSVSCDEPLAPRTKVLLVVLFLIVVLIAHGRSLRGDLVMDDIGSIVDNDSIHSLSSPSSVIFGGQYTTVSGRPLLNATLALNYALSGTRPEGYRLFNYGVHAATAFVLFSLLRRVFASCAETRTVGAPLSLAISLLWCVHPLTINGVSYIVQRAEAIASCFYLLVLWGFIKGVQTSQRRWFVMSVLAAWLGSFTKEIIATVPLTVIALDVLVVTRDWRKALRQHWGFYLSLLTSWLPLGVCMWASKSRDGTIGYDMGVSLQGHLQTQVWAFARYLRLAVWPRPLIFDYGDRFVASDLGAVLAAAVVLVAFGTLMSWLLVRRSPWAFPGVALCLLLAPTSVIPIATQTVAEHRMYLASACVITMLVLVVFLALSRVPRFSTASQSTRSVVFGGAWASVGGLLLLLTVQHSGHFSTTEILLTDIVTKHPTNQRAVCDLALIKFHRNTDADNDVALQLCDRVIGLPGDCVAVAFEIRGKILVRRRERQKAIDAFTQAIALRPTVFEYFQERAVLLRDLGRLDEALRDVDRAMALDAANINNLLLKASIHSAGGDLHQALASYDRVLAQDSSHVVARVRRIRIYARLDRWQDALQEIQRLKDEGRPIDEKLVRDVEQHLSSNQDVAM